MSKAYTIIFESNLLNENLNDFLEIIRSSYISKKFNNNTILISAPTDSTPSSIYRNIESKLKFKASFMVIKFDSFFGNIPTDVSDWFETTFDIKLKTDQTKTEINK